MSELTKRKIGNSDREKYWNEDYVQYWKARVEEANKTRDDTSLMVAGDVRASTDDLYIAAIDLLQISEVDKVLELGCGFGRSLPTLCRKAFHVIAVDISKEMINVAKESCQEDNVTFYVAPSEDLPFPDSSFDVLICFAAFDAMYQPEALVEINRVVKVGAKVLITGKNDDYSDDDSAALAAERGARAKGHPNYFTDVKRLIKEIDKFGFAINTEKYFVRRGDFAKEIVTEHKPALFYEYLFVLVKTKECIHSESPEISNETSKTFSRRYL